LTGFVAKVVDERGMCFLPSPARGEGRNHRTPLQRGTFATKPVGGEGEAEERKSKRKIRSRKRSRSKSKRKRKIRPGLTLSLAPALTPLPTLTLYLSLTPLALNHTSPPTSPRKRGEGRLVTP